MSTNRYTHFKSRDPDKNKLPLMELEEFYSREMEEHILSDAHDYRYATKTDMDAVRTRVEDIASVSGSGEVINARGGYVDLKTRLDSEENQHDLDISNLSNRIDSTDSTLSTTNNELNATKTLLDTTSNLLNGHIIHNVKEVGSNANGHYIRYDNGFILMWGLRYFDSKTTTDGGGLADLLPYPIVEAVHVSHSFGRLEDPDCRIVFSHYVPSVGHVEMVTNKPNTTLLRFAYSFFLIGRWK